MMPSESCRCLLPVDLEDRKRGGTRIRCSKVIDVQSSSAIGPYSGQSAAARANLRYDFTSATEAEVSTAKAHVGADDDVEEATNVETVAAGALRNGLDIVDALV